MCAQNLNLKVGHATLGLKLPNRRLKDFLLEYFMGNISDSEADLSLDVKVMSRRSPCDMVPDSLFHAKRKGKKGFRMEGGIMDGYYSSKKCAGLIHIHPVLLETDCIRVFEQILYQAYVTVTGKNYGASPLIHSSGVIKDGKGYIFVGPSEAGKSTVAELSRSWHVVNDEITIADLTGNEPRLLSTPFNGLFREKEVGNAPLAGIFLLNKDRDHKVSPVDGGEAVKLIASQVIPPVGLDEYLSNNHYLRQVDIASSLSRAIPLYNLYFAKNEKFWDIIDKIER